VGPGVDRFEHHAGNEQYSRRDNQLFHAGRWAATIRSSGVQNGHFGEVYDRSYSGHAQSSSTARVRCRSSAHLHGAVIRDFITPAFLDQNSFYLQDTYSRKRLTAILGLRWDRQVDQVAAVSSPAHAFQGQPTIDGTPFNLFPAIDVPTVRAGVVWNTFAPRLGLTYDLTGDATNVIKGSYAIYFDQRSAGQLSKALNRRARPESIWGGRISTATASCR